jgi:hypothetical protein
MPVEADNLFAPSYNIATHGFALWDVVRRTGANSWTKAQADSAANIDAGELGLVVEVTDTNNVLILSRTQGFRVKLPSTNGLAGSFGDTIWLSTGTEGDMTLTKPTADQVIKLGVWHDGTEIVWDPWPWSFNAGNEPSGF